MRNITFQSFIAIAIGILVAFPTFSQKEKEVKVKVPFGKLSGTLLMPKMKNAPIVLIIPGSGPTDRNGNSFLMQPNSYKLMAEALAENNIASLRYDKAGVGKSSYQNQEKDMRFADNVQQVTAWIDYLQKKKYQNIILLGHSEGALIATLAAQERAVAKVISLAGSGRPIDEILKEQLKEQAPDYTKESNKIIAQLKAGKSNVDCPPELAPVFRKSVQPYLISWMKYDPKIEVGKLTVPLLIVNGNTDIQVQVHDGERQKEGNNQAEFVVIDGMNHILKKAPADKNENTNTYYNPKLPLHEELMKVIVGFVGE